MLTAPAIGTDAGIYDDCLHHALECYSSTVTAQKFYAQVKHNSTEQVVGAKVIEALCAIIASGKPIKFALKVLIFYHSRLLCG